MFLLAGDGLTLVVSLLIVAVVTFGASEQAINAAKLIWPSLWEFGLIVFTFLSYNWLKGNYTKKLSIADTLNELSKSVFVAISLQSVLAGLVGNRALLLGLLATWALALALIPFTRLLIKHSMYQRGLWAQPTVILGAGRNAVKAAKAIQSDWLLGYHLVEFINFRDPLHTKTPFVTQNSISIGNHNIPVRNIQNINSELFSALGNPHIVVAIDSLDFWEIIRMLYEADVPYSRITIAPSIGGVPMIGLAMTHVFRHDVLMLTVQNNLARFIPRLIKRSFDLVAASFLILLALPLFAVLAVAVRSTGQNIFYGHKRIGKNGNYFNCYKFRSMHNDSDRLLRDHLKQNPAAQKEWQRDFKLKNDPRITNIGKFLRRTSLDELPQLWNVVIGDMSLVGPRPVIDEEIIRYQDKKGLYQMVRPGITGLWQVSGRNDVTYEERVNLDTWYSKNWSLWYDIVILFKTLNVVIKRSGAY
jgi:Undecaprenyl-phosphate galactose phosphotransferase, WbaP/exopolysaccharide biosynthesis polyprenyl glycosylphosphotransferase